MDSKFVPGLLAPALFGVPGGLNSRLRCRDGERVVRRGRGEAPAGSEARCGILFVSAQAQGSMPNCQGSTGFAANVTVSGKVEVQGVKILLSNISLETESN